MRLQLVTPPAVEPLALADAKLFLRVDIDTDDSLISGLIAAARQRCETELRQALVTQTWTLYLDAFPSAGGYYNRAIREIWPSLGSLPSGLGFYPGMVPNSTGVIDLPLPPLQQVLAVQYDDFAGTVQTVPASSYVVSLGTPGRIQPQYSKVWPLSRPTIDSVRVTFTCGYGDTPDAVPAAVGVAMKFLIYHWYEHREAVSNLKYLPVPNTFCELLGVADHGSYA